jgi:hypothetical protein
MVNAIQELSRRYLEKLYELSEQDLHSDVDAYNRQAELWFSPEESRSVQAAIPKART